jgi:hypothetical protein
VRSRAATRTPTAPGGVPGRAVQGPSVLVTATSAFRGLQALSCLNPLLQVYQIKPLRAWGAIATTLASMAGCLWLIAQAPWYMLPFAWALAGTAFTGVRRCPHPAVHSPACLYDFPTCLLLPILLHNGAMSQSFRSTSQVLFKACSGVVHLLRNLGRVKAQLIVCRRPARSSSWLGTTAATAASARTSWWRTLWAPSCSRRSSTPSSPGASSTTTTTRTPTSAMQSVEHVPCASGARLMSATQMIQLLLASGSPAYGVCRVGSWSSSLQTSVAGQRRRPRLSAPSAYG